MIAHCSLGAHMAPVFLKNIFLTLDIMKEHVKGIDREFFTWETIRADRIGTYSRKRIMKTLSVLSSILVIHLGRNSRQYTVRHFRVYFRCLLS